RPRRGGRRGGGRLRRRLSGRRLRDPALCLRRGHRRRDGEPQGRGDRQPPRRPPRQLRQGAVSRAVVLHAVRPHGRDPRRPADRPVRAGVMALLGAVVVLAALVAAPPFLGGFLLTLLTQALIYAILAMSLDILLGYTGLSSL